MKKKIFGIKIGTLLSALLCLVFAFAFWFVVKYSQLNADDVAGFLTHGKML